MLFVAQEGSAMLLDLNTSSSLCNYASQKSARFSVCFCPLSGAVVLPQANGSLMMLSTEGQQPLSRSFTPDVVTSSVCSHGGLFLIAGTASGLLLVWNTLNGQLIKRFKAHRRTVNCVCISSDNSLIASVSEDALCKVWLLEEAVSVKHNEVQPSVVFSGHSLSVNTVQFLHFSNILVTGSSDKTCRIFSAVSGEQLKLLTVGDCVTTVAVDSGDNVVALGTVSGYISFNPLTTSSSLSVVHIARPPKEMGNSPVVFLHFLPGRVETLLCVSENSTFTKYTKTGKIVSEFFPKQKKLTHCCCLVPFRTPSRVVRPPPLQKNPTDYEEGRKQLVRATIKNSLKRQRECLVEEGDSAALVSSEGEKLRDEINELIVIRDQLRAKIDQLSSS